MRGVNSSSVPERLCGGMFFESLIDVPVMVDSGVAVGAHDLLVRRDGNQTGSRGLRGRR